MRSDFADDACVSDIAVSVGRNVIEVDGTEGVRSGDTGLCWVGSGLSNALAKASEIVRIGRVPCRFVRGVAS